MIRDPRVSPLWTVITWMLVLLMVEPQTRLVGQESSTYIRALEVLLTPSPSSILVSTALLLTAAAEPGRPTLGPITNQTINVGQRLSVSVKATDRDLPAQSLQFALLEKPAGATVRTIRGTNAVIGWTPTRDSADTTNRFTVVVSDNGTPSLSATQSFQVIVTDFAQSALGTTVIQAGQDGCLPLTIDSSETITNIEMTIRWPRGTFTNFTVTPTAPQICSATLQSVSPTQAVVRLFTCPGQSLTLTQAVELADLCFTALPGQPSAFVPLIITNSTVRTLAGNQITNRAALAGTVVVVGSDPLLEITRTADQGRQLFLYANPGRFYQIDATTNLSNPAAWQLACRVPMTGPALVLCCVDLTGPTKFFRARELGAGPTNEPPRVDAGPDQFISTNITTLHGSATDDGLPAGCKPLTYAWSRVSGPGPATFSNPTSAVTTVSLSARGTYVFRLSASDTQSTNSDDVTISAPSFNCSLAEEEGWLARVSNPLLPASPGSVQFTNCTIVLNEGGSFEVAAEKAFVIPATPLMLVLTYETPTFDSTTTGWMRDAFEVALVDDSGKPLTFTIQGEWGLMPDGGIFSAVAPPSPDAVFNHTEGRSPFVARDSTITPTLGIARKLFIDARQLIPGSNARLILRLINNDRDAATKVRISNLGFELLPAPPSTPFYRPLLSGGVLEAAAMTRLSDLSASVKPDYGITSLNEAQDLVFVDLALRNEGTFAVRAPLVAVVSKLSDPSIRVVQPDGQSQDHLPYYIFSDSLASTQLNPGSTTPERTLILSNPHRIQFTFELQVLGQLNHAPKFTTSPVKEALPGRLYSYAAQATDPDSDPLTFTLVSGPTTMIVNPTSGVVSWSPDVNNLGSQNIRLRVDDSQGGLAEQSYTLLVNTSTPNRPPVFTSTPVVEARIDEEYRYQSSGFDPDGDSLLYSIIGAPLGMTINPTNGLIKWIVPQNQSRSGLPSIPGFTVEVYARVNDPSLMSFSPGGVLYVGRDNSGSGGGFFDAVRIHRIGRGGTPVEEYGDATILDPDAVLFDPVGVISGVGGSVLVGSSTSAGGLISAIPPSQHVISVFGPSPLIQNPVRMLFDSTGRFLYSENDQNGRGRIMASRGTFPSPLFTSDTLSGFFALDHADRIFTVVITNTHRRIEVHNSDGTLANKDFLGGFSASLVEPDISVGSGGAWGTDLYILNDSNLYRNRGNGQTQLIASALATNGSMTFGPDGALYVSDFDGDRILRIAPIETNVNVRIQVSDERGGTAAQSYIISVLPDPANHPPVIISQPVTSIVSGQTYTYDVVAIDPDTDRLAYALPKGPDGMAINPTNGLIQWTPTTNSLTTVEVMVSVSDDRGGTDQQAFEIEMVTPGTLSITGSVVSDPSGGEMSLTNGTSTGAWIVYLDQNENGRRDPGELFTAADTNGVYSFSNLTARCYHVRLESQPHWLQTYPTTNLLFNGGFEITTTPVLAWPFTLNLTNGDTRLLGWQTEQSNGSGIGVNHFTFVNAIGPVTGTNHLVFNGGDSLPGGSISQSFCTHAGRIYQVSFEVARDSFGGGAMGFLASATAQAGATLGSLSAVAPSSPGYGERQHFSFVAQSELTTLSFRDISSATLSVDVYLDDVVVVGPNEIPGAYHVALTEGATITGLDFGVSHLPNASNHSPQFVTIPPPNHFPQNANFLYESAAIDADGDSLTYDLVVHPDGMLVETNTGVVAWRALVGQVGVHDVILRVRDGRGGVAIQSFNVTVLPQNTPPVIVSTPPIPAVVNLPYQYQVRAQDAEGDALSFALVTVPPGMSIAPHESDLNSALLSWLPGSAQAGTQSVTLTVTDARGALVSQIFNIPVLGVPSNNSPVIISQPVTSIVHGQTYTYDVDAIDPDGDALVFSIVNGPEGMAISSVTGLAEWSPTKDLLSANVFSRRDDELRPLGWDFSTLQMGNGGNFSFNQANQGGNQGDVGLVNISVNGAPQGRQSAFLLFAKRNGADYDPASHGAILSINYSIAERIDSVGGPLTGLGLRQGGKLFVAHYFPETQVGWKTNQLLGLSARDFVEVTLSGSYAFFDSESHPQFETNSGVVEVGFVVFAYSGIDTGGINSTYYVDQWQLDILPTKEIPVEVKVEDGRGSAATQSFSISTAHGAQIHGFAFTDFDRDGTWNRGPDLAVVVSTALSPPNPLYVFNGQSGALIERLPAAFATAGTDGFLYGQKGNAILKYDPQTGLPFGIVATNVLSFSSAMTFGPNGNLFVSDTISDSVLQFVGQTGNALGAFASGSGLRAPSALSFAPDGSLYVAAAFTGNGSIFRKDSSSFQSYSDARLRVPIGLTITSNGLLYLASYYEGNILIFNTTSRTFERELVPAAQNGGLAFPTSLAVGPDDNLYVASPYLNKVFRYNRETGVFIDYFLAGDIQFAPSLIRFMQRTLLPTNGVPEPGVAGRIVFTDQNRNGRRDAGEQFTLTDTNGQYAFTNISAGTYFVREEPKAGWSQTAPSNQVHVVTVADGQVVYNIDFGNFAGTNTFTNFPPSFVSSPPTNAAVGTLYRYDSIAVDPNSDALTYTLLTKPAGMAVDLQTGTVVWNPQGNQYGSFDVVLRANDPAGLGATQSFVIKVEPALSNHPPVIISQPVTSIVSGQTYTYDVDAIDPDNEVLGYSLVIGPPGMSINSTSGLVRWEPDRDILLTNVVRFTDGDFHPADWSDTELNFGNGGIITYEQRATGGDPGGYRRFVLASRAAPSSTGQSFTLHFYSRTGATYDPRENGAILSLDYSVEDIIHAGPNAGQTGIALRQNGKIYVAPYSPTTKTWETNRFLDLKAADFSLVEFAGVGRFWNLFQHPDFSTTGAPIEFGFFKSFGTCIGCGAESAECGVDNWTVSITPAPSVEVGLEVLDSSGGMGGQSFRVTFGDAAEIRGFKYDDSDGNGVWNRGGDLLVDGYLRYLGGTSVLIERMGTVDSFLLSDGSLYGVRGANIEKFDGTTGEHLGTAGRNIPGLVVVMTLGPDGNIYASDTQYDSVISYDPRTGQFLGTNANTNLDNPVDLAFGPDGNLYVCGVNNNSVNVYGGTSGVLIRSISSGSLVNPWGLTFGPNGNLFVSGFSSRNIVEFELLTGNFVREFVGSQSGGLGSGSFLDFGPDGHLYVSNPRGHNILRYDGTNGTFLGEVIRGDARFTPDVVQFLPGTVSSYTGVRETGLPGTLVYLDQNRNGRRDVSEQFSTTDLNGQYAFTNLPAGTYFVRQEPQPGRLQTAPSNQVHMVTVANGQVTYNIDFGNFQSTNTAAHQPPAFVSTPITKTTALQTYRYDALAVDPQGSPLVYSLPTKPGGMAVDPLSGTIVWTPQLVQAGAFDVVLQATDGFGLVATQRFAVSVVTPNLPPSITSTPQQRIRVGFNYSYQILASDPNGDGLTYSLLAHPTGMAISSSGLITWTPAGSQMGSNSVNLRVDDGRGAFTTQSFSIDVTSQQVILPPTVTSAPRLAGTLGQLYAYDAVAANPNSGQLTWSFDVAPTGMSINSAVGTVRWTPTLNQLGTNRVALRVFDGQGGMAVQAYEVIVRAANLPPSIVSIPPTTAVTNRLYTYALQPSDPENDPLALSLAIAPTNMTLNVTNGVIQWIPSASQIGPQNVEVRVEDLFGGVGSQTFTIVVATNENRYPVINSTPTFLGVANQPYRYQLVASDPDGDPLSYALLNGPAGMTISTNSGLVSWLPTTAQIGRSFVTVAVVDAFGASGRQSFSIDIALANTPPQITSANPSEIAVVGLSYRYDVRAIDPDGDPIIYRRLTAPPGMTIDAFGRVAWIPALSDIGTNEVVVQVQDSHGTGVTQAYDVLVLRDTTIPLVNLSITPNPAELNARVFFNVRASDQSGQPALGLTLDGVPMVLDAAGGANFFATRAGLFPVVASATDAAGNVSSRTNILQVIDPSNTNAPVVFITSPTNDAMLTSGVDIIGSVEDDDLVSYTLYVIPAAGGDFKEIGHGLTTVTNGVLGRFDPATLNNDSYVLLLSATDAAGHTAETQILVHVAGDLKLGNFRLSFTDLTVPVAGIPITISRTYDTMNSTASGDFGYGWRLEFRETALRSSVPNFANEIDALTLNYIPFRYGTRVYTTLPGGRRQGFTFRPVPRYAFVGVYLYKPAFVADSGVTSELRVPDSDQHLLFADPVTGDFRYYASSQPYNPANSDLAADYTLTTKEGIRYQISSKDGKMSAVTDLNTNRLTFTSAGITSSSGAQVLFTRDPQGRITAVTDPMGKQVRYAYDAKGDLVSVTDRETNTTRFVYHATPAHYLKEVVDPLGRSGVRANYDAQGLLAGLVDAGSNTVQLIHDPANFVEKVVDTLGTTNTYEYDTRGNVVTEVNALGAITRRSYDLNNNMLTEVDPLGHTNSFTYDSLGNVLTRTDAAGNVTRFTYNSRSQVVSTTDPLGNTTLNEFDTRGNLLSTTDPAGKITRYTYDGAGNATSITDAAGNVTRFTHDGAGRLLTQTDALNHTTSFDYDANGNQIAQTNSLTTSSGIRQLVTRTEYDASGHPIAVVNAEGHTNRTEFDKVGQSVASIDPLGHRTQFIYDERGKLIHTVYPDGASNSIAYNAAGHRISSTDRGGRTTRYQYDPLGRLVTTIYPDSTAADLSDNPRTRTEYDLAGRVVAQFDERTNRTEFFYDAAGRQVRVRDALSNETWTAYDPAGRQMATTNALGRVTQFVYDELGRRTETILADNTRRRTVYDTLGRVMAEVDQAGVTNRFEYDALGRLTNVVDALGHNTAYAYNEAGNLIRQQDANNHVTRYEFDSLGRRISTILPLGQRSGTLYNPVGNVSASTNFNGQAISLEYDQNNRLARKILPPVPGVFAGHTNEYTHTSSGRRETITDPRGLTTFTYDERDRLTSRTDPDGQFIRYRYDLAGNRTAVITASGTNRFTFDPLNRLETVTDPDGGTARYYYDAANNSVLLTLPNGTVRTNAYDELNRVKYIEHRGPTNVIASYRYTLGPTGNRVAVQEHTGRQVGYDYDALYRLVRERVFRDPVGPNPTNSYVYDPVGNRLFFTNSLEGVTAYAYDNNDQLLTETLASAVTRYAYDANGNTLSRSNAIEAAFYVWSPENRLIAATVSGTNGAHQLAYQYNDDGIRVAALVDSDETRYLIDANRPYAQVVEEWTSLNSQPATLSVSYTHGPHHLISQRRSGTRSWYHADALGSTRALTGQSGSPTDRYHFDAYGRALAQSGPTENRYLFAGEQRDRNLGLDYLRARYIRTHTGRFISRDTAEGTLNSPLTLNLYAYANGNPANATDPSGNISIYESFLVVSSIAIVASTAVIYFGSPLAHAQETELQLELGVARTWANQMAAGFYERDFDVYFDGKNSPPHPQLLKEVAMNWQRIAAASLPGIVVFRRDINPASQGDEEFAGASIIPGDNRIWLRAGYFSDPQSHPGFDYTRPGVLIHEIGHLVIEGDLSFNEPYSDEALGLAKSDPARAAKNPDNYRLQAEHLFAK